MTFSVAGNHQPFAQHCYITGGSTGLGLELAVLLTKLGANVSIVARDKGRLEKALQQLEVWTSGLFVQEMLTCPP